MHVVTGSAEWYLDSRFTWTSYLPWSHGLFRAQGKEQGWYVLGGGRVSSHCCCSDALKRGWFVMLQMCLLNAHNMLEDTTSKRMRCMPRTRWMNMDYRVSLFKWRKGQQKCWDFVPHALDTSPTDWFTYSCWNIFLPCFTLALRTAKND